MKKSLILTLILFVGFVQQSKAQTTIPSDTVEWTYCHFCGSYPHDTLRYFKTQSQVFGSDTLSLYQVFYDQNLVDTIYLKEGGDTTFYYQNGVLNFLYANDAQIGDVWYPLNTRDHWNNCNLDLTVIAKDSILISGQWLNRFKLNMNYGSWSIQLFVVEKIGTFGSQYASGIVYDFLEIYCNPNIISECFPASLLGYRSEALNYSITQTQNCYLSIDENSISKEEPLIKRTDNRIEVTWNEKDVELELYNISGQKVKSTQKNSMVLPQEQGIYFLHIQQNSVSRVVKLAN